MADSPDANAPAPADMGDIASPDVRDAKGLVARAEADLKAYLPSWDPNFQRKEFLSLLQKLEDAREALKAIEEASAANAAARRSPSPPTLPIFREGGSTDRKMKAVAKHSKWYVD
ncbi:g10905 [Coccomyxa elongata]